MLILTLTNNILSKSISLQYHNLFYNWQRLWTIWSESCALIGYLSGKHEPNLPARNCPLRSRAKIENKNRELTWTRLSPEKHKKNKKELGQYQTIVTSRLVNNAYILCNNGHATDLITFKVYSQGREMHYSLLKWSGTLHESEILMQIHYIRG